MVEQKATVKFDPVQKTLTFEGELIPATPAVHDILAELVAEHQNFTIQNNVVRYSFTISLVSSKDATEAA